MSSYIPRGYKVDRFLWWWKLTLYRNGRVEGQAIIRRRDHAYEIGNTWMGTKPGDGLIRLQKYLDKRGQA